MNRNPSPALRQEYEAGAFIPLITLFMSMRSGRPNGRLESRAELVFVVGLGILAFVAIALAFAIR